MSEHVEGQLTLFLEDSPASRSPLPGSKEARKMTATSGQKWLGLSKNRPTWIVGENVAGIVKMALPDILSELEACGYRTRTFLVPACAVGARHRRYRVAIVGYSEHNGSSPAAVARGTQKTGGGKQEGKKETGEFAGAGRPGNSQNVGRAEDVENSGCCGCGEQGNVCEQSGRTELERTGKAMAYTESKTAGRLPVGEKQEITGSVGCCENVSDTNGAGLKEQHFSEESDKTEFADRRINERDICDTSGKGLPHRTDKEMGGSEQKQEPERSDRRSAESVLGGMADGIPDWMDRDLDFLINHYWDDEPDIPRIATGIDHRCDRLKCLGNAVVPQQFYPIFKAIVQSEQTKGERRWIQKQ